MRCEKGKSVVFAYIDRESDETKYGVQNITPTADARFFEPATALIDSGRDADATPNQRSLNLRTSLFFSSCFSKYKNNPRRFSRSPHRIRRLDGREREKA